MATTELGACEWFVWDLRRSNLIDRGQLDQVVNEFLKKQPRGEPPALAQFLVQKGFLTSFQVERLLQGKTQGMVLGPYTLQDALGSGSMGTVYKAQSKNDGKWYAVKVLPRRSMWNVRIARRQVRAFEQCRHPAVVPFVDVGTSGGTHYLAWPLVEGVTLDAIIQQNGKVAPGLAALYALQTAEGLEVCNKQNLVHGLVKPSNLMVGTDQQIRILDFGIGSLLAEAEGESLVDTMSTANSLTSGLDCTSPESNLDPTKRTPEGDQYSLGCVLYYLLTGSYPFPEGTAVEKMMAHQTRQPQPVLELNPDVPEALVAIVERLMQKRPEDRYRSMGEVVENLKPLAASPAVATRLAPRTFAAATPSRFTPIPGPGPLSTGGNGSSASRPTHETPQPAPAARTPSSPAPVFAAVTRSSAPPPSVTRESLHARPAAAVAPAPPPSPYGGPPDLPQQFHLGDSTASASMEERFGPVGVFLAAVLIAGLTGFLTWTLLNH